MLTSSPICDTVPQKTEFSEPQVLPLRFRHVAGRTASLLYAGSSKPVRFVQTVVVRLLARDLVKLHRGVR